MEKLMGLPVTEHPRFFEVWNLHSSSFNKLAEMMEVANIDISYLNNVIDSVEQLERLSIENCFGISLKRKEVLV